MDFVDSQPIRRASDAVRLSSVDPGAEDSAHWVRAASIFNFEHPPAVQIQQIDGQTLRRLLYREELYQSKHPVPGKRMSA
jgi:hypothetical protein